MSLSQTKENIYGIKLKNHLVYFVGQTNVQYMSGSFNSHISINICFVQVYTWQCVDAQEVWRDRGKNLQF
jgi:hypothetical protein